MYIEKTLHKLRNGIHKYNVLTESLNPSNLKTCPSRDKTFTPRPLATLSHSTASISLCLS